MKPTISLYLLSWEGAGKTHNILEVDSIGVFMLLFLYNEIKVDLY
jgi:hypothetical protein